MKKSKVIISGVCVCVCVATQCIQVILLYEQVNHVKIIDFKNLAFRK